jgi:hypothetical protein
MLRYQVSGYSANVAMRTQGEILFVERLKVRIELARECTFVPEAGEPDMKPAKSRKEINESHCRLGSGSVATLKTVTEEAPSGTGRRGLRQADRTVGR